MYKSALGPDKLCFPEYRIEQAGRDSLEDVKTDTFPFIKSN
ncbi:hypothetical protein ACR79S_12015 [Sphingobacterium spiritivorum]